jgi:hypothetical protein
MLAVPQSKIWLGQIGSNLPHVHGLVALLVTIEELVVTVNWKLEETLLDEGFLVALQVISRLSDNGLVFLENFVTYQSPINCSILLECSIAQGMNKVCLSTISMVMGNPREALNEATSIRRKLDNVKSVVFITFVGNGHSDFHNAHQAIGVGNTRNRAKLRQRVAICATSSIC